MASKLVAKLKSALGERLTIQGPEVAWPLLCSLELPDGRLDTALYLAGVGPSGRPDRPFERRIQNPSGDTPIVDHPGRASILLGIHDNATEPVVLVAWDAFRRRNRTTRYSAFVHEQDLMAARTNGTASRTSTSGETIYAFQPRHFGWAVAHLLRESSDMEMEDLDYDALASGLAELSDGDCPFERAPTPFQPADVDWSADWLMLVTEVQEWLVLDEELRPEDGPEEAATQLFRGLAAESPTECFTIVDGHVQLTAIGHSALAERVSEAGKAKTEFQNLLDQDISIKEAARRWRTRWEEAPSVAPGLRANVHARVETWKVKDFKDNAQEKTLDLNPSYQRDLVWSTDDSQMLIDSMLRGIPLPSIILNQRKDNRVYEIVDGKQRLTAILRFIGCHPAAVRFAKTKATPDANIDMYSSNYKKWKRKLGIQGEEERGNCLPFPLADYSRHKDDPLAKLSKKFYHEIAQEVITIQGEEVRVRDLFEGTASSYTVPVIIYKNTDLAQIHKVFGLYNKQGKQLIAEELRNAVYHHLGLTRLLLVLSGDSNLAAELAPFVSDLPLEAIPSQLKRLQVREARFHRTKLASWVAALLVHAPNRGATPSTAGFIDAMLDAIAKSEKPGHPMSSDDNLKELAKAMSGGALLLGELAKEQEAFVPRFSGKNADGVRWEDLPVVAAWTACTLAHVAGVGLEDTPAIAATVRTASEARPTLDKQQSRTQWGYIARTVLELLEAMGVDESDLDRKLKQTLSFSCLTTFRDIDQLAIPLR